MNDEAAKRMCGTKKRFPTMIQAAGAIGHMRGKFADAKSQAMRWYKCPICHGYHLTTTEHNAEYQKRKALAEATFKK